MFLILELKWQNTYIETILVIKQSIACAAVYGHSMTLILEFIGVNKNDLYKNINTDKKFISKDDLE